MNVYSKTEGHHCWWLNLNGKAIANFDEEESVDQIIDMEYAVNEMRKDVNSRTAKNYCFECRRRKQFCNCE